MSITMQEHLEKLLSLTFSPSYLEVVNESHNHSGERTDSHFKIIVVSKQFEDMALIKRHRQINELFKEELTHIHALAIHTYTPSEWMTKTTKPISPLCMGSSK